MCLAARAPLIAHSINPATMAMASTTKSVALVLALLAAVHSDVSNAGPAPAALPRWVERHDRRLLLTDSPRVDAVVAQDGSGGHTSIGAALAKAPPGNARFTVHVKAGVYAEVVEVYRSNVMLIGDGAGRTVITGNRSNLTNHGTPCTATVSAQGAGFMARDLTIENTAGPGAQQAVAFLSNSNRSVVFRCEIKGYQDTLLAENHLQFYRDCEISGTIDIVFGNAAAVFQNCVILARRPLGSQHNVVTAQGRNGADHLTGFSFQGCNVTTSEDLSGVETYLGRPWRDHSRVVFMQSYLDAIVHPAGWVPWKKDAVNASVIRTIFYGEYNNSGPGAGLRRRVRWPGFHTIKHAAQARKFTVEEFIHGGQWLPGTGVAYNPGL